jgi:primosomal protein N' (replication factor Y)
MARLAAPDPERQAPGTSPPPWIEVWLEAGREGRIFTYSNPRHLAVGIGDLVQVALQGRRHGGLVVGCLQSEPEALAGRRLQPLEAVLQPAAADLAWRELIADVAKACHTSGFRTLKSALPPGWLGQRRRGAPPGSGRRLLMVERAKPSADAPGGTEPVELSERLLSERQRQLLAWLRQRGDRCLLKDVQGAGGFSRAMVATLERRGWLILRPAPLNGLGAAVAEQQALERLQGARSANAAQAAAVAAIAAAPQGQALLLWGVTGAGKTEVYLQAAARELAAGRSVLMLAPEIGLIPQLLDRARARLGSRVLEYHSGMGQAERVRAWRACLEAAAAGEPLLAVGTRSAIFLPLDRLGLIVLDEEHDSSYKQESPMPCYHARDVARMRARRSGARLVLGSATPSLESWSRCRGPGADTQLLRLPRRIGGRPLPPVRVVDMRHELAEGHRRLVSRALMGRLQAVLERREQAVVLVPRRGYRAFLSCRSCGEAVLCPHCDVSLTVHRGGGGEWLRCHWCDHRQPLESRCGSCGSTAFKPFGAGTQRVQEQLAAELSGLRLLRFDQDTTRGRDGHRQLLERFAAGEADVLVGTQMLAKGMDLPRVTLAAVLAADGLLHRPDLRAAEQCLQLLLQLAGRAGRGELPGEVLVQTYCPEHPVIRHLVDGRYGRFLEEELSLRRNGGLVPFSRACLLRLAGPTASGTATAATALTERIRPQLEKAGWVAIGPAPAPVARVAGRSRWQVLLHGPAQGAGRGTELPLPAEAELRRLLPAGVSLAIDPDPLQL